MPLSTHSFNDIFFLLAFLAMNILSFLIMINFYDIFLNDSRIYK